MKSTLGTLSAMLAEEKEKNRKLAERNRKLETVANAARQAHSALIVVVQWRNQEEWREELDALTAVLADLGLQELAEAIEQ